MTDQHRYRITRGGFDVVSVFGSLGASAVPGPVITSVLALHGYSESAARNQVVRLVSRGLLHRSQVGRIAVYRLAEALRPSYGRLAGRVEHTEFFGAFAAAVLSIPEARRSDRDRVLDLARRSGYRPLRPGVLIALTEAVAGFRAEVGADIGVEGRAWLEFCSLVPEDMDQARRWADRAFGIAALRSMIGDAEARVAAALGGSELGLVDYFDLYYAVSGELMSAPVLPADLAPGLDIHTRLGRCMGMLNEYYWAAFGPAVLSRVQALPNADLIEWDPQAPPAGRRSPRPSVRRSP